MADNTPTGAYCHVILWVGELFAARCIAEVLDGDGLLITSLDDDRILRMIPAGDWTIATVYGGNGQPIYSHRTKTPTRKLIPLAELRS